MANGKTSTRGDQTVEQWLADIERRQTELETEFRNFLTMVRNTSHMTSSYLDRKLGYTTHEQQRQAREKKRK